jgi:hypothetical protein
MLGYLLLGSYTGKKRETRSGDLKNGMLVGVSILLFEPHPEQQRT